MRHQGKEPLERDLCEILGIETLPTEGVLTPEIAELLRPGDEVLYDGEPNPRNDLPRQGWYKLVVASYPDGTTHHGVTPRMGRSPPMLYYEQTDPKGFYRKPDRNFYLGLNPLMFHDNDVSDPAEFYRNIRREGPKIEKPWCAHESTFFSKYRLQLSVGVTSN
ncbi:hypothetical protein HYY73_02305 [Candidatus Woesearchaeota archaeon]|nr:hypothetical protein [Candidatus Woesearchaeota archaeon]